MPSSLLDRLAYSPEESAQKLGLSRSALYDALRRGDIRSVRIGGRRLIPAVELARVLGSNESPS